ncbi:MAG: helix-turn-helix transcriptional regulator [Tepidisphaeraceae bacterium]
MEPLQKRFGRRVRELREARGWTQEQLGRAARLDPKHIGVIERGQKASSFEAVTMLAGALRVDEHELFLSDGKASARHKQHAVSQPNFASLPKRELEQLVTEIYKKLHRTGGSF